MTPNSPNAWRDVSAARLPAEHLTALAPIRHRADVRVVPAGDTVWVRWTVNGAEIVQCLLPVPGVAFFTHRAGVWFPFGRLVPTQDAPPEGEGIPVAAALGPARFVPLAPEPIAWNPLTLTVVRGGMPQPVTALTCAVEALAGWADVAPTAELAAVQAAFSGHRVILLGNRLPVILDSVRYWGTEVLVPVGFRPDPELPCEAIRAVIGVADDEVPMLDATGAEVIPRSAFEPLTRAGVRLGIELP